MDTQEEYKNFLECYYFDYNVLNSIISFWDSFENTAYQTSFCLYLILKQFYDLNKICIPYSMAHIWDVIKGTKNYENKIEIIKEISKKWYVSEDDKDNNIIRIDKCGDIIQHFDDTFESMKLTDDIQMTFNPLIENMFKISMFNDSYSSALPSNLYNKLIDIYNEKPVKSVNDIFQFTYKMIHVINIKNYINLENLSKEKLIEKIELYLEDSIFFNSINVKTLSDYEMFSSKNIINFQQSEFSKKVFMYSLLCDYIGITKEKKNKIYKEAFTSGMINDLIHLSIGLRCSIFVTNDKNLKVKAIICKILLNSKVKIFDIEDFYQYLVNEYVKIKYPEANGKDFSIPIKINDKIYQKTVKTDFERIFYS